MLVTGGSGFVGAHVIAALRARGWRVRALVRGGGPGAWPPDVETANAAGLDDPAALAAATAGCEVVVHLAGRAHVTRERSAADSATFDAVNAAGTRAVATAAAAAGARLVVHASSIAAVATTAVAPVRDDTPPWPDTPYGRSKLAAEAGLRAALAGAETAGVSLRPPMMYGPGMRGNPLRLFSLVARGVPLPLASVRNRRSVLYVANFAAVVAAVAGRRWTGVHEFAVADEPALSTAEFARAVGRALGRPARLVPVPMRLLRVLGSAGSAVRRVAPFPVDATVVDRFSGSLEVDDARLRGVLGPVPAVAPVEALARTAEWFRGAG